jgi:hypothetical protein
VLASNSYDNHESVLDIVALRKLMCSSDQWHIPRFPIEACASKAENSKQIDIYRMAIESNIFIRAMVTGAQQKPEILQWLIEVSTNESSKNLYAEKILEYLVMSDQELKKQEQESTEKD